MWFIQGPTYHSPRTTVARDVAWLFCDPIDIRNVSAVTRPLSHINRWRLGMRLTFQNLSHLQGFYKSAKVILNILRKSKLFKDLVEKVYISPCAPCDSTE